MFWCVARVCFDGVAIRGGVGSRVTALSGVGNGLMGRREPLHCFTGSVSWSAVVLGRTPPTPFGCQRQHLDTCLADQAVFWHHPHALLLCEHAFVPLFVCVYIYVPAWSITACMYTFSHTKAVGALALLQTQFEDCD